SKGRVFLRVTRGENRLNVIEIVKDHHGSSITDRQYSLDRGANAVECDCGIATNDGQKTVLHHADRTERWRLSRNGSELIVDRLNRGRGPLRTLTFHRARRD